jgi:hypothetical protein
VAAHAVGHGTKEAASGSQQAFRRLAEDAVLVAGTYSTDDGQVSDIDSRSRISRAGVLSWSISHICSPPARVFLNTVA